VNYSELSVELKSVFDLEKEEILLSSGIRIRNLKFISDNPEKDFINPEDPNIRENKSFIYPVFCPKEKSNKVILMLHGLNERSWSKYLAWAFYLAQNTSSYVILFPISFHMNRSPESWSNPRSMSDFLNFRNSIIGKINNSSFANIALSNRLSDDPLRFFNSGYQTVNDIVKLVNSVKTGTHPEVPSGSRLNIFGYSIGAFLSEIIMMGNPGDLFTDSKLFIFCGGSVFSNMNGSSKLIMDKRAFARVYDYYMKDFEEQVTGKSTFSEFFETSRVGLAFRSMIDINRLLPFRERLFAKLKDQISVIALEKDTVIPLKGIIETMRATGKKDQVRIMDFKFQYSHENPFPVFNNGLKAEVDDSFEKVFSNAAGFLA
jgi:hypothetical protein